MTYYESCPFFNFGQAPQMSTSDLSKYCGEGLIFDAEQKKCTKDPDDICAIPIPEDVDTFSKQKFCESKGACNSDYSVKEGHFCTRGYGFLGCSKVDSEQVCDADPHCAWKEAQCKVHPENRGMLASDKLRSRCGILGWFDNTKVHAGEELCGDNTKWEDMLSMCVASK